MLQLTTVITPDSATETRAKQDKAFSHSNPKTLAFNVVSEEQHKLSPTSITMHSIVPEVGSTFETSVSEVSSTLESSFLSKGVSDLATSADLLEDSCTEKKANQVSHNMGVSCISLFKSFAFIFNGHVKFIG
jgi:hypothetical protein